MKYIITCEKCGAVTNAETKEGLGYMIDEEAKEINNNRLNHILEMEEKYNESVSAFEAKYKKLVDEADSYNKKHNTSAVIPKVKTKFIKKNKDGYTIGTISHDIEIEQEIYEESTPVITFMSIRCIKCGICGKKKYLDKDITLHIEDVYTISEAFKKYGIVV